MQPIDVLNVLAQAFTAIGVFIAWKAIQQNATINRKQMNMQIFLTYTDRFDKIMQCFPDNAFQSRYGLDDTLPPESKALTLAVIKYLNMVSEEYYLHKRDYLDTAIWHIWESEIKRTLCSPLIRREWPKVVCEFVAFDTFARYVQSVQKEGPKKSPPIAPTSPSSGTPVEIGSAPTTDGTQPEHKDTML